MKIQNLKIEDFRIDSCPLPLSGPTCEGFMCPSGLLSENCCFCLLHLVAKLYTTLCDPREWSLPCSAVSGASQARTLVVVQCSVLSDSLWPHGQQHARLPCPSPSPQSCLNICLLSQGCCPVIMSFVVHVSFYLQSFPASGCFSVSYLHQVAKILEFQLQHQTFQWIFRTDFF